MISILKNVLIATLFCLSASALPTQAAAEDVPIVDGTLWMQSSDVEKRSYIIGAIAGDARMGAAVGATAGAVVDIFGR